MRSENSERIVHDRYIVFAPSSRNYLCYNSHLAELVAVAQELERRSVEAEVAGARPVSHPSPC